MVGVLQIADDFIALRKSAARGPRSGLMHCSETRRYLIAICPGLKTNGVIMHGVGIPAGAIPAAQTAMARDETVS